MSNVYTFAIFADSKTGEYPVYVDFRISYEGEYYKEDTLAKLMEAEEIKENPELAGLAAYLNNYKAVCNWPDIQFK